jgi:hypothetical protein
MVIRDFYFVSVMTTPIEADPVLVVDANAELPLPITAQFLQPVSRRVFQIIQFYGRIEHSQFAFRDLAWR